MPSDKDQRNERAELGATRTWSSRDPAGARDTQRAADLLAARLPPAMRVFADLAYDFACFWTLEGRRIFAEIDEHSWERCGRNPVRVLSETPTSLLVRAAGNRELLARAQTLREELDAYHALPLREEGGLSAERPVAYFCAEFGVHQSLQIYSGGLGVLAGDMVKEASDVGIPMVGMGLYYHQGYFHQQLDRSGWQQEYWIETPPHRVPLALVTDEWGIPRTVSVRVRGEEVVLQIWRAQVGRASLYLLDADRPENSTISRWLTARLYDSEREVRLAQYALLGIGGIRALRALGVEPAVVHLNEGHAALAIFELTREGIEAGLSAEEAVEAARQKVVFTTHTPVAAGNETYSADEIWRVLGHLPEELGLDAEKILGLGRVDPQNRSEPLGLTVLALRASRAANAVSRIHGDVSRGMWRSVWPQRTPEEVPITHVTNGVHLPSWMAPPVRALLDRYFEPGWIHRASEPATWEAIDEIPDAEIWAVRNKTRRLAIDYMRERGMVDALRRGEQLARVEMMGGGYLEPDILTLGFARRLTAYKRLDLLIRHPRRLVALLNDTERPIQILVSGKAHPLDHDGKHLLTTAARNVLQGSEAAMRRTGFTEDYDLAVGARIVAGCDVWLNLPRPPLEASGTSGMKSMLNGGLNLSVLDGWWAEAFDGSNGWGVTAEPARDEAERDARDAGIVLDFLENEIVPLFYDRDANGVPRGWVERIKQSLRTNGPRFCATRMLEDYVRGIYTKR